MIFKPFKMRFKLQEIGLIGLKCVLFFFSYKIVKFGYMFNLFNLMYIYNTRWRHNELERFVYPKYYVS